MKSDYDTLVLNRLYFPVHIISWKAAMSLLYTGKATAIDVDYVVYDWDNWIEFTKNQNGNYCYAHSAKYRVAIPDILILQDFANVPRREIKYSRENVFHRDGYVCQYCGKKFKRDDLTIDHVVPKSHGGSNNWDNIVSSCEPCNAKKADRTPGQANMHLMHPPSEPQWYSPLQKVAERGVLRPNWSKFLKTIGAA